MKLEVFVGVELHQANCNREIFSLSGNLLHHRFQLERECSLKTDFIELAK